jgi:ABC-type glycerol-3-phosphate transport system permease component
MVTNWWWMAAVSAAAIIGIPLERYIVKGLTAGAVK